MAPGCVVYASQLECRLTRVLLKPPLLLTCAHGASCPDIWEANRDTDVLNHCTYRDKHVPLPKASWAVAPTVCPAVTPWDFCGLWWVSQEPGGWLQYGGKAKLMWLGIAECRFSHLCLMCCMKAQVDQGHPALSHHCCRCISSQVNSKWGNTVMLSCYLSHLFP